MNKFARHSMDSSPSAAGIYITKPEQYSQIELVLTHRTGPTTSNATSTQYGFTLAGYCPCHIENVLQNSIADRAGLQQGDLIIKVNGTNCCRARIKTLLALIKPSPNSLKLTIHRKSVNTSVRGGVRYVKATASSMLKSKPAIASSNPGPKAGNKILQKLFSKPSISTWLSCAAQPLNQLLQNHSRCASSNKTIAQATDMSMSYYPVVSRDIIETNDYVMCMKECCALHNAAESECSGSGRGKQINSAVSTADTGYESLSRYDSGTSAPSSSRHQQQQQQQQQASSAGDSDADFTIDTITNTLNSYSQCDLTVDLTTKNKTTKNKKNTRNPTMICRREEMAAPDNHMDVDFDESRTNLIGDLIELEADFVTFMSMAVSTFSRPLRGFFMKQHDYFDLFQNIEKILIISENFLRSMDKWSAYDLYTKIGQLYAQKISLFKDALTIYAQGYSKSKSLYDELTAHSKQFRLFLKEVQTPPAMTLSAFLDMPIVQIQKTLELFKQIRKFTPESKRNPSEAPHIDSVIFELRRILSNLNTDDNINLKMEQQQCQNLSVADTDRSTTFFMNENGSVISTIIEEEEEEEEEAATSQSGYAMTSCCSSSTTSDSSTGYVEDLATCNYSSFFIDSHFSFN